jgi:hypothetical protein
MTQGAKVENITFLGNHFVYCSRTLVCLSVFLIAVTQSLPRARSPESLMEGHNRFKTSLSRFGGDLHCLLSAKTDLRLPLLETSCS